MYIFSIPDSPAISACNGILLSIMEQHTDWLQQDTLIETAYGCPPHCLWNGNRSLGGPLYDLNEWSKHILARYYYHHIAYRLTFTNFLVQKQHLQDPYANAIAGTVNNYGGSVMVSTQLMANHMLNYSRLKICWSTTTDFGTTVDQILSTINRLSAHSLVVLPYVFNNTPTFLQQLQHPENIEVLVNEQCIDNCPRRREHWTRVNKEAIESQHTVFPPDYTTCFFPKQYDDPCFPRKHLISPEMLPDYAALGINHFKISGRLDGHQTSLAYLQYLIKPHYRENAFIFAKHYMGIK